MIIWSLQLVFWHITDWVQLFILSGSGHTVIFSHKTLGFCETGCGKFLFRKIIGAWSRVLFHLLWHFLLDVPNTVGWGFRFMCLDWGLLAWGRHWFKPFFDWVIGYFMAKMEASFEWLYNFVVTWARLPSNFINDLVLQFFRLAPTERRRLSSYLAVLGTVSSGSRCESRIVR